MNNKTVKKGLFPYVFLMVFILVCLFAANTLNVKNHELSYDEFISNLNDKKVTEIEVTPKTRTETYDITGKLKNYDENETFSLTIPKSDEFISKITKASDKQNFELNIKKESRIIRNISYFIRSSTNANTWWCYNLALHKTNRWK